MIIMHIRNIKVIGSQIQIISFHLEIRVRVNIITEREVEVETINIAIMIIKELKRAA